MTIGRSLSLKLYLMFTVWVLAMGASHAANRDETIFFFNDALGSAVAAVSESGELCWSEVYTPYGDKTVNDDLVNLPGCGIVGEERGFTGHTEDVNSDLVYMQQRYYDPSIGRFLSVDPMDVNPTNPMTYNRYAYANNNPNKYVDPDGEFGILAVPAYTVLKGLLISAGVVGTATVISDEFVQPQIDSMRSEADDSDVAPDTGRSTETDHTASESRPPGDRTGDPNSIWEQQRSDGSMSITYYDENGRRIARDDHGQRSAHGNLGQDLSGRTVPHQHEDTYSDSGYTGSRYRELDNTGKPIGDWVDDR